MTETNSIGTAFIRQAFTDNPGSAGFCHLTVEIKIYDDDSPEVANDAAGRIWMRKAIVSFRPRERPDYSRGENTYPAKVEAVLTELSGIFEVIAFGIADGSKPFIDGASFTDPFIGLASRISKKGIKYIKNSNIASIYNVDSTYCLALSAPLPLLSFWRASYSRLLTESPVAFANRAECICIENRCLWLL